MCLYFALYLRCDGLGYGWANEVGHFKFEGFHLHGVNRVFFESVVRNVMG